MNPRHRLAAVATVAVAAALLTGCTSADSNSAPGRGPGPVVRHWDASLASVSHFTADSAVAEELSNPASPGTDWNPDVVALLDWPHGYEAAVALRGGACFVSVDGGTESRGSFGAQAPLHQNDSVSTDGVPKSVTARIGASQLAGFSFPGGADFELSCGVEGVYLRVSGLGSDFTTTAGLVRVAPPDSDGSSATAPGVGFFLTAATTKAAQ